MATLMVALDDGVTVPLSACDWVFYHACGCPRGVTMAQIGDVVLYDEEQAWRDFFGPGTRRETDTAIRRARRAGVTAELMTHARYSAEILPAMLRRTCPHTLEGAAEAATEAVS